jgi:hypothetical protein
VACPADSTGEARRRRCCIGPCNCKASGWPSRPSFWTTGRCRAAPASMCSRRSG